MNYKILFDTNAIKDLNYWKRINNQNVIKKIKLLLTDIQQHPFTGIGKPEALKNELSGYFSRRINKEHRLVYTIKDNNIIVIQCRYHY